MTHTDRIPICRTQTRHTDKIYMQDRTHLDRAHRQNTHIKDTHRHDTLTTGHPYVEHTDGTHGHDRHARIKNNTETDTGYYSERHKDTRTHTDT